MTEVLSRDAGTARIAVPSKGRLRDEALQLLGDAGYPVGMLRGGGSIARLGPLDLIEMRPRDAAAALAAGSLDGAFVATDIAAEEGVDDLPTLALGFARSDLVVASRDDDGRTGVGDLEGGVVATHLPASTRRFFDGKGLDVRVVPMGGALEGICAAGLADAIVDLRETGTSLAQNRLRVLEVIRSCEAAFVHRPGLDAIADLELRLGAVLTARAHRYVMLHVPAASLDALKAMFPGLASPTVLPLAGRDDLLAVHFVLRDGELWERLGDLRAVGATGIVALQPRALLE